MAEVIESWIIFEPLLTVSWLFKNDTYKPVALLFSDIESKTCELCAFRHLLWQKSTSQKSYSESRSSVISWYWAKNMWNIIRSTLKDFIQYRFGRIQRFWWVFEKIWANGKIFSNKKIWKFFEKTSKIELWVGQIAIICSKMEKAFPNYVSKILVWL